MTATRPFIPRPKDRPAWWAEEATPEELEAVVRERTARELRERRARESRNEKDARL